MTIGFLIYSLRGGGAERTVSLLANKFAEMGYSVFLYIFDGDGQVYQTRPEIKIRVCKIQGACNRFLRLLKRSYVVRKAIQKDGVDILFAFTIAMVPFSLIARIGAKFKIIGSERANPYVHTKAFQLVIKYLSPLCNGFIFQTEGAKNYYPIKTQNKGTVIPNIAPAFSKERNIPKDIRICSAGRLHSDKDYSTLLQAFGIFSKVYPDSKLTIYGEGPQKEELVCLADRLGIKDKIIFCGFARDILDELNKHTMFVFSSKSEGMPNALLEAMSVGLPCISTNCRFGPEELITNGVTGWLVSVGDAKEMAEYMEWVVENPADAKRMGEQARIIQEVNSERNIIQKYVKYMRWVMNR